MQAGVAMGLAKAVAVRFPSWGPDFVFLMVWRPYQCFLGHCITLLCTVAAADIKRSIPGCMLGPEGYLYCAQMSVIMMNLFTGPPMFRSAVISTGEARALQLPSVSNDTSFPSPKCVSVL